MNASELLKACRLQEAIEAQSREVKTNPADQGKRLFLFELLAFAGDLERARRQIEALHYDEPELEMAGASYRQVLDAEAARRRIFQDGLTPQFLAEPPEHVRLRLEAVNRLREGRPSEARAALDRATEITPLVSGQLNNKPFEALRDCDDLFAGVLEVMSQGNYYWLPFEQIATVAMNPPQAVRDLLWVPAHLEVRDGPAGDVFLPALYSGSHEHPDDQVKLGRATDWKEMKDGPVLGAGLRTFLAGDDAVTLLEWRQLEVGAPMV